MLFAVRASFFTTQSPIVSKTGETKGSAHNLPDILVLHGTAQIMRGSKGIPLQKKDRKVLLQGDIISTEPESIAMVDYGKGTFIRLAPGTKVTFSYAGNTPTLYEYAGSVYVRFLHIIGVKDTLTTETDNAIAGVEGTKFLFWLDEEGNTNTYVNEHAVTLRVKNLPLEKDATGTRITIGQYGRGIVYKNDPSQVLDISYEPLEAYDFALLELNEALDDVRKYGTEAAQLIYSSEDWKTIDVLMAEFFSKPIPGHEVLPTVVPTLTSIPPTSVVPSSIPHTAKPQSTPSFTPIPPSSTPVPQPTDVPTPTPEISGGNQLFELFNKFNDLKILLDSPTPTPTIIFL